MTQGRRTKIIATVGPASESDAVLRDMMLAGMDVVRLNLSHGTLEAALDLHGRIRRVAASVGRTVGTLVDLPGPKLRAGSFGSEGVDMTEGHRVHLVPGEERSTGQTIQVDYPDLLTGIEVGDQIVSFNGTPITEWTQAQSAIRQSPAGEVPVVVIRNGVEQTLTVDLKPVQLPVYGTDGKPTGATESRNFVGLVPGFERQTDSVATVPGIMWDQATHAVSAIVTLPVRMYDLVRQTVTDEPRDPNGIVGVVGVGRLTGDAVALETTPALDKTAFVLSLLAGLNLFLFLFNLIPLLPLDGGHVAGAVWEALKRGWARLRHLPTPPPVDIAKALPLTYVVSGLLLVLGAITIVADLVKPITLQ